MSSSTIYVSADTDSGTVPVGVLYLTERSGSVSGVFSYDTEWLARAGAYALDPGLPLVSGAQAFSRALPGAISDSAPDRWGRQLIRKSEQLNSGTALTPTLGEGDYLLAVSDETRQGALRFHVNPEGPYLAEGITIPPLLSLPRLRRAAWAFSRSEPDAEGVKELLAAGSASLGGARPKASVRDGDTLRLAKFSHPSDEWDVIGLECVALDLADACGIDTPSRELLSIDDHSVLLVTRFDRSGASRIPYLSAMSLTGFTDGEACDYLDVGEAVMTFGGFVTRDLRALWRRLVFFIAINNLDDHPRNHGFLGSRKGWSLSPLFDVNPSLDGNRRNMTVLGSDTPEGCASSLHQLALSWMISERVQREIVSSVVTGLGDVERICHQRGINRPTTRSLSSLVASGTKVLADHFSDGL